MHVRERVLLQNHLKEHLLPTLYVTFLDKNYPYIYIMNRFQHGNATFSQIYGTIVVRGARKVKGLFPR